MLTRRALIKSGLAVGVLTNSSAVIGATSNTPKIFNIASSASANDIIYIQGANFGANPRVMLNDKIDLTVVASVSDVWMACQLPLEVSGAPMVAVLNGDLSSQLVQINFSEPWHLDCLTLAPGGVFKVFGRNLKFSGYTPMVTVDGLACVVSAVDEHQLNCVAPAGIKNSSAAKIVVSNGLTSATLERTISVDATGSGDPLGLGVGWAACFSTISGNVTKETTLTLGTGSDQTAALQALINTRANTGGGGVLQLRAGTYRCDGGIEIPSNVILAGAGKANTTILKSSGPLYGSNHDRTGIRDLTVTFTSTAGVAAYLVSNSRFFLQRVRFNIGKNEGVNVTNSTNIVVQDCDFMQTGKVNIQSPFRIDGSAGAVVTGCTANYVVGSMDFHGVHDSYVANNTFTINTTLWASLGGGGILHGIANSHAYRVCYRGNVVDTDVQTVVPAYNDRECFLTEGSAGHSPLARGTVTSATSTTLVDSSAAFTSVYGMTSTVPENMNVYIVAGKGMGQRRQVISRTTTTLTVPSWDEIPDATSRYSVERCFERVLILGNTFGPKSNRGIWIYQCPAADVVIKGNTVSNIYLRQWQSQNPEKMFFPQWNLLVADNAVKAAAGKTTAVINSLFVTSTGSPFGIANLGLILKNNSVTASQPNFSPYTDGDQMDRYGEGYVVQVSYEAGAIYGTQTIPPVLGPIIQDNVAINADNWLRVGTGIGMAIVRVGKLTNSGTPSTSAEGSGLAPQYTTLPSRPNAPTNVIIAR